MSGWIKFWKDMPNDPRVFAAAQKLSERYVLAGRTPGGGSDLSSNAVCNAWRNAVTGALVTLWVYADEHIRDDDTLDLTSQTLDAMVGLEGFFDAIARDWVDELDDGRIILPGYGEKNSLIAKRKRTIKSKARVTQWRQDRKRASNDVGNGVTSSHVTHHNRAVDLDQDLYKDKEKKEPPLTPQGGSGGDDKPDPLEDLNLAAWDHYVAYRKSAKLASLKAVSIPAAQRQLVSFGDAAAQLAAVKQTVANGWTGLFAVKSATGANNGAHRQDSQPRTSTVERVEQATADWATERGVDPKTI